MPRYRDEEYDDYDDQDRRGVHRRRYERKKSNTGIIVGVCIVCAAILGIFVFRALLSEDDPAVVNERVRAGAERFLMAALSKDPDKIFENMNPEGANGWVNKNLGQKLAKRYRFWADEPDREKAMEWRREQDERMVKEIVRLVERLALDGAATIESALQNSKISDKMSAKRLTITNQGGVGYLWLLEAKGGSWVVQNWEILQSARGRTR